MTDAKKKPIYVYRHAGSGKFVAKRYAFEHPGTTVREQVKR